MAAGQGVRPQATDPACPRSSRARYRHESPTHHRKTPHRLRLLPVWLWQDTVRAATPQSLQDRVGKRFATAFAVSVPTWPAVLQPPSHQAVWQISVRSTRSPTTASTIRNPDHTDADHDH